MKGWRDYPVRLIKEYANMNRKIIFRNAAFLAILLPALLVSGCGEEYIECPPGYRLQVNAISGKYRPCTESGIPLVWFNGSGTKQEAIARAWRQYNHDIRVSSCEWIDL